MKLFFLPLIFLAQITTTHAQVNAHTNTRTKQVSNGKLSPNQSNTNGDNTVNYNTTNLYINNYGLKPISEKSTFQEKQEILLLAEHPTTLEITNLSWGDWLGDSQPFLNVELTNVSNLPALELKVELLNNETGATIASLKPYVLSESYTLKILKDSQLAVGPKSKWSWPLASIHDMSSILNQKCITDAGLSFRPMRQKMDVNGSIGISKSNENLIYIRVTYKSIFGQILGFTRTGVVDSVDPQSDFMILRKNEKAVSVKCVGSPEWNNVVTITTVSPE